MNYKCPLDQTELVLQTEPAAGVFRCGTCFGIWLPASLVAEHIGMTGHVPALPPGDVGVKAGAGCPEDAGALFKYMHQGVELDVCSTCRGVWLDRGELEYIRAKLTGTASDVPAAEPLALTTMRGAAGAAVASAANTAGNVAAAIIPAAPDMVVIGMDVGMHALGAVVSNPQTVELATDAAGAMLSGAAQVAPQLLEAAGQTMPDILGAIFELIGGLLSNS